MPLPDPHLPQFFSADDPASYFITLGDPGDDDSREVTVFTLDGKEVVRFTMDGDELAALRHTL